MALELAVALVQAVALEQELALEQVLVQVLVQAAEQPPLTLTPNRCYKHDWLHRPLSIKRLKTFQAA